MTVTDQHEKLFETFKDFFAGWKNDIISYDPEDGSSIIVVLSFGVKRFGQDSKGDYFMETL